MKASDQFLTPRRSTRHAAKLATERIVASTNKLRRTGPAKEHTLHATLAFDGLIDDDVPKMASLNPPYKTRDPVLTPRRSTRRAAKLANERLVVSTNKLRRTHHAKDLCLHQRQLLGASTKVRSNQVDRAKSERIPLANLSLTPKQLGELCLRESPANNTSKTSCTKREQESAWTLRCFLLMLTAMAKIFGVLLYLLFTSVHFGYLLLGTIQNAIEKVNVTLFCLGYMQHWLKDTTAQSKCTRLGLVVTRWVFIVYFLLPGFIWLTETILRKYHAPLTCVALLASLL